MSWTVQLADEFQSEFLALDRSVRIELAANGVWRVAFAFDPQRRAILLAAGDKSGIGEGRFYRSLIRRADSRFDAHLARMAELEGGGS